MERNLDRTQERAERRVDAQVPSEGYRAWIAARLPSPHPALQKKDEDGDFITLKFDSETVESRFPDFEAAKKAAELRMREYYRRQREGDTGGAKTDLHRSRSLHSVVYALLAVQRALQDLFSGIETLAKGKGEALQTFARLAAQAIEKEDPCIATAARRSEEK